MGIDIYAKWRGQTDVEREKQHSACFDLTKGGVGYLREAYHGQPYATRFLCIEAFETGSAHIPASKLVERLPHALTLVGERQASLYHATEEQIEEVRQSFRDFVALCLKKEAETGEPVRIVASY